MTGGSARLAPVLRSPVTPLAVAFGVCAAGIALQWSVPFNHDVGWLLVATRQMLGGATLYVDAFVDVNPPLVLVLLAPAILAADALGVSEIATARITTHLLGAGTLWLSNRVLRTVYDDTERGARYACVAVLAFVTFIWPGARLEGRPGADFGQREHWLLMLLLPYLIATLARWRGARPSTPLLVVVGLLAGLGVGLKPPYLMAIGALEQALVVRSRSLRALARPELAALLSTFAAYLVALWLLTPAYFEIAVPLGLRTYWAYQKPVAELVAGVDVGLFAAGLLVVIALRRPGPARELSRLAFVIGVGCYAAYLVGGTRWPYHLLPYRSLMLVTLACPLVALVEGTARGSARISVSQRALLFGGVATAAFLAMLVLPLGIGSTLRHGDPSRGLRPAGIQKRLAAAIERDAPGGTVWFLASSVRPAFPVVNYTGAAWTSRFSCLWPLPAVIRSRARPADVPARIAPEELEAVERDFVAAVIEDFEARPPDLVFVDTAWLKQAFGDVPFDFPTYLGEYPEFARQWSHYERLRKLGKFDLYRRRP